MSALQLSASLRVGKDIAKLLDESVGNEELLKSHYRRLADSLVSEGVIPSEVCKTARKIIESEYKRRHPEAVKYVFVNSWFSQCMFTWGYTDPSMARHRSEDDPEPDQNNRLTFEHEVSADSPFAIERNEWIEFCNRYINLLEVMIRELRKDVDIVFTADGEQRSVRIDWEALFADKAIFTEFLDTVKNLLANVHPDVERMLDQRQMFLPQMRFDVMALCALVNAKHFGNRYFVHVKNLQDVDSESITVTTKKIIQFKRDDFSINDWFQIVRDEAWKFYFMEMKCPECRMDSLRQHCSPDGTWGWVCKNRSAHDGVDKHFPHSLFYHRLEGISANYKGMADKQLAKKGIYIRDNEPVIVAKTSRPAQ